MQVTLAARSSWLKSGPRHVISFFLISRNETQIAIFICLQNLGGSPPTPSLPPCPPVSSRWMTASRRAVTVLPLCRNSFFFFAWLARNAVSPPPPFFPSHPAMNQCIASKHVELLRAFLSSRSYSRGLRDINDTFVDSRRLRTPWLIPHSMKTRHTDSVFPVWIHNAGAPAVTFPWPHPPHAAWQYLWFPAVVRSASCLRTGRSAFATVFGRAWRWKLKLTSILIL